MFSHIYCNRLITLSLLLLALLLSSCSNSIKISGSFPEPLVNKIPLKIGLLLNDSFKSYKHEETIPQQSSWLIDMGDANIQMISNILSGTFEEIRIINNLPVGPLDYDLDIVITPYLDKFEFEVPITGNNLYAEAWIQYEINFHEIGGKEITKWLISGYGKYEISGSKEQSLNNAAIVAMREIGATFSTSILNQPDLAYWLENNSKEYN
jgi:hypothetical protein